MTKKIKISESELYEIIKQVLLEQEEEKEIKVWNTNEKEFKYRLFRLLNGNSEKFAKYLNMRYDKIVINGSLDFYNQITSLPDNLHVRGNLDLRGTPITSLPNNLHVGGYLNLRETPITSLPDNLHVEGYLDLEGTPIESLPDNLVVKRIIFIYQTPLNNNNELVEEYVAKGYKIYRSAY
jgi:hypothetical protein